MSDELNNQTLEANPGEAVTNVPSAEGQQNVVQTTPTNTPAPSALPLEKINQLTGHNYASLEEAEKGLKHLTSLVGAKIEAATPEEVKQLSKQLKEVQFYADNPEFKEYKGFLSKFGSPDEAIKDPEVQKAITAMKSSVETDKNKASVLNSSRIGFPPKDDYNDDLERLRSGRMDAASFMEKHKGLNKLEE